MSHGPIKKDDEEDEQKDETHEPQTLISDRELKDHNSLNQEEKQNKFKQQAIKEINATKLKLAAIQEGLKPLV